MKTDIGVHLVELIDKLYDIHIELWDIVDMKKSNDDKVLAIAGRRNNCLVKMRSAHVEQIDDIIIQALMHAGERYMEMNDKVGKIIEELGFEKIHIHEANRETGRPDEPTPKCEELKGRLQKAINTVIKG